MNYEVKITKVDNGFNLVVVDKDADGRVPKMKFVATSVEHIAELVGKIFDMNNDPTSMA